MRRFLLSALMLLTMMIMQLPCGAIAPAAHESGHGAGQVSIEEPFLDGSDYVSDRFESTLPILLLEKTGEEQLSIAVFDGGTNRIDAPAALHTAAVYQTLHYESEDPRPKADYFLYLTQDGAPRPAPLLGLAERSRWYLLGGMYDRSLIRNYLGYTVLSLLSEDAPRVRLCEVLIKESGGLLYQGVYLLVEGPPQEDTVVFSRTERFWSGRGQTVLAENLTGLFVLQENHGGGGAAEISAAAAALTEIGSRFSSEDTNYYLQYDRNIDRESFLLHFIVNEFLLNYESMNEGMYSYNPQTKKVAQGSVLNFERALDNGQTDVVRANEIRYQNAPFYAFMVRDGEFLTDLTGAGKRYSEVLNSASLNALIDDAVRALDGAQARDWRRWGHLYLSAENALAPYTSYEPDARIEANGLGYDADGALLVASPVPPELRDDTPVRARQLTEYDGEILRLRHMVNTRPGYLIRTIALLRGQDDLWGRVNAYGMNTALAIGFFCLLAASVAFARRVGGR